MKRSFWKRQTSRMFPILLVLIMLLGALPVHAAGTTGSITITAPAGYELTDMQVDAYLVLQEGTAVPDDAGPALLATGDAYTYVVTEDFRAFFAGAREDYTDEISAQAGTDAQLYLTYDTTGRSLALSTTQPGSGEYLVISHEFQLDATYFEADLVSRCGTASGGARMLANWVTQYIKSAAETIQPTKTVTAGSGVDSITLSNLTLGYYAVITSKVPAGLANVESILKLATEATAEAVQMKVDTITIEKEVDEVTDSDVWADAESAGMGEKVKYQITTQVPDLTHYNQPGMTYTYKLTDIIRNQTIDPDTVQVSIGGTVLNPLTDYLKGNSISLSEYSDSDGNGVYEQTLTLDFDIGDLRALLAKSGKLDSKVDLVLTYQAELMSDAALQNCNTVELEYAADPYDGTDTNTAEDSADVYTYGIDVDKSFSDGSLATNGQSVKFELRTLVSDSSSAISFVSTGAGKYKVPDSTDVETPVTSLSIAVDGTLYLYGLDEGTYYLVETATAAGFTLLEPVEIVLTADGNKTKLSESSAAKIGTVDVTPTPKISTTEKASVLLLNLLNQKGFELPGTGGMGTYLFAAGGVVLIAVAGALYIWSRRRDREHS